MTDPDTAKAPGRILVIDDEEIIHVSLRRILRRLGHQVDAVLSAKDGLSRLYESSYDLVISDLMMPEMNGIQLLQRMKDDHIDVPVLMVTGYPTISTAVKALRLGAVDYLAKPFTRQELISPVNRALRRSAASEGRTSTTGEFPTFADGLQAPEVDLAPGDTFYLREHSWAVFRQDGAMDVGIERSFIGTVGTIEAVEAPHDGDLVEQGYVSIKLTTESGEVHSVFTPLSGQVVEVNTEAIERPDTVDPDTWIVRILPTRLEGELDLLKKRQGS